jgi:hypothetical protein
MAECHAERLGRLQIDGEPELGARGNGAKGATDRGLDGVGSEPSVGQPGSLQRARPAVEVALAPKRQQLRQVRQA